MHTIHQNDSKSHLTSYGHWKISIQSNHSTHQNFHIWNVAPIKLLLIPNSSFPISAKKKKHNSILTYLTNWQLNCILRHGRLLRRMRKYTTYKSISHIVAFVKHISNSNLPFLHTHVQLFDEGNVIKKFWSDWGTKNKKHEYDLEGIPAVQ